MTTYTREYYGSRPLRQRTPRPRRGTDLRELARGKQCALQLPLETWHDPETVVLAHIKEGWYGKGVKPPDILAIPACADCHNELDRRTEHIAIVELRAMVLQALYRTLLEYVEQGIVTW